MLNFLGELFIAIVDGFFLCFAALITAYFTIRGAKSSREKHPPKK